MRARFACGEICDDQKHDEAGMKITVFHLISDYDHREGWDEARLYRGLKRTYFFQRDAERVVTYLDRCALEEWEEPVRYAYNVVTISDD
jgi:hypothetical protein